MFNPIQDRPFRAAHGRRGLKGSPYLICYIYPKTMKLGSAITHLKTIQKFYKSCDTSLKFSWHHIFLPEISNFRYIRQYKQKLNVDAFFLILLTFTEPIQVALIKMIAILMMSAKLTNPAILEIEATRPNLWLLRHQQNFITWLIFYCRGSHVMTVW